MLFGGEDDDELIGGSGSDIFAFFAGNDDDTISDFDVNEDILDLGGTAARFVSLAEIEAASSNAAQGGVDGLLIDTGAGDSVFLEGLSVSDLPDINIVLFGDGNDTFFGGPGNATFSGGAGRDTFRFFAGNDDDTITDFTLADDTLDLSGTATDFTDLASVQSAATNTTQNGVEGLLIDTGAGDSVFLEGLNTSDLGSINFVF
jgi:Ca2+-binding RTX toxin-like protein